MSDLPDAAVQLTDDEYMLDFGDGAEELLQIAAPERTSPDENMVNNFLSRFLFHSKVCGCYSVRFSCSPTS